MRRIVFIPFLALALCITAQEPKPYFVAQQMPDAYQFIPAPPEQNDMRYAYDTAQYQWGKRMRNTPRGEKARLDAEYSLERMSKIFSPIIGMEISQDNTPQLWKLLQNTIATAECVNDNAKTTYMRKRPYMVFNEPTLVPEDEEELRKNGSYPSGHTLLGWTTALVLVEIDPDVANEIIKEGYEYGQSRVIAGYHWQSDVDMARLAASAAFARIQTSRAYQKQLRKAQREFFKKSR
ncbi:MAG: phosphatase PAP2 family protein [Paludibacteraceae bacterium]|nr:phosphatase PAP2 family protein [Paludibacteraceae bacterium]